MPATRPKSLMPYATPPGMSTMPLPAVQMNACWPLTVRLVPTT
jgi:hypothetical protein